MLTAFKTQTISLTSMYYTCGNSTRSISWPAPFYTSFFWSLLICSSIVFRERGIVMSQSLLSSQPITNSISNWYRLPPQYCRNKLIMVFFIHYLAVSNNHCSRFWVRIIKEKYLLVNKPLPKLHSGDTCLGPEGVPYWIEFPLYSLL